MNRAIEILKDYKKELEDIKKYYKQSTDDLETISDIDQALQLLQPDVVGRSEQLPESEKLCRINQNFICNCIDDSRCPNF